MVLVQVIIETAAFLFELRKKEVAALWSFESTLRRWFIDDGDVNGKRNFGVHCKY
jgi:hypothetical protein